jgi:hypothetical protein
VAYYLKCPKCGKKSWLVPLQIKIREGFEWLSLPDAIKLSCHMSVSEFHVYNPFISL